ncbi:fibronectin type III domain-containing protein [Larkinella punicea]|uniref:T9SS C-terminal target domain-containing protein n=1 Tax=Larkinella punicea TaxID=2315727 RepID=A0A368JKZ0_9BACT|nr:fibronectin type III domain-containing protein [Larkinella punicea]RCR67223.1 T9SS C-terminal target domain-containing protein [Larkinella punicea]
MKSIFSILCLAWLCGFSAFGQNVKLAAMPASSSEVVLTWSVAAGKKYSQFSVEYLLDGKWGKGFIAVLDGNARTCKHTGLKENTKYTYRIYCIGNPIEHSNEAEATTLKTDKPAAPVITSTEAIWDGNSEKVSGIKVKWKKMSDNATGFVVSWALDGVTQGFSDFGQFYPNLTEHTIKGSWPGCGSKIEVKVRAVINEGGFAPVRSSADAVSTLSPTVRMPDPPQSVKATPRSETVLAVSWEGANKPESVERTYIVLYSATKDFSNYKTVTQEMNTNGVDLTGLLSGTTYYLQVYARNCGGQSQSGLVTATTAAGSPPTAPVMASSLAQSWTGNSDRITEVLAEWLDKSGNETGFEVQWGDNDQYNGGSTTVEANKTQHKITGSWPGCGTKIYLRVRAKNAGGNSDWSTGSLTTGIAIPEMPYTVVATPKSSSEIELTWKGANESYSRESEFKIVYGTNPNALNEAKTASMNSDKLTISGLNAKTTYYFRIKAKNCAGESSLANAVSATTQDAPPSIPPKAPTILKSLSRNWTGNSDKITEISFSWNDNSSDETEFDVQWGTDSQYSNGGMKSVGAGTTSFKAEGRWDGCNTRFFVRVRARKGDAASDWSVHDEVAEITAPEKPSSVLATAKSTTEIDVQWRGANESFSRESEFVISYNPAGQPAKEVKAGMNTDSYTLGGLLPNTRYVIVLKARNCKGDSEAPPPVEATTQAPPVAALTPPSHLTLSLSGTTALLIWQDNSSTEAGFQLERSVNGAVFEKLAEPGPNTITYKDENLRAQNTYAYRIRAYTGSTTSDYSNTISVNLVITALPVPRNEARLFPNPVSQSLTLTTGNGQPPQKIRIRDAAGRLQQELIPTGRPDVIEIPVSQLPNGQYYLEITGNQRPQLYRFLKQ